MSSSVSSRYISQWEKKRWVPNTEAFLSVKFLTSDFSPWSCCIWSDALICNWMTKSSSHPYLLSNWKKTLQCNSSLWFFCIILHFWKWFFVIIITSLSVDIFISTEMQNMRDISRLCACIYGLNWRLKRVFILHLCWFKIPSLPLIFTT